MLRKLFSRYSILDKLLSALVGAVALLVIGIVGVANDMLSFGNESTPPNPSFILLITPTAESDLGTADESPAASPTPARAAPARTSTVIAGAPLDVAAPDEGDIVAWRVADSAIDIEPSAPQVVIPVDAVPSGPVRSEPIVATPEAVTLAPDPTVIEQPTPQVLDGRCNQSNSSTIENNVDVDSDDASVIITNGGNTNECYLP